MSYGIAFRAGRHRSRLRWTGVAAGLALAVGALVPGAAGGSAVQGGDELIAFTGAHWTRQLAPTGSQIDTIHADGSALRRLTRPGAREDTAPAWTADGTRIAFARRDAAGWRLYVMNGDSSGLRAITRPQPLADSPSWSPDGRRIAFVQLPRNLPKTGCFAQQVYVVGADGTKLRRLTSFSAFEGGAGAPAWSPEGTRILFSGRTSSAEKARTDIWVSQPNGAGMGRLIPRATDPAWSPDGETIAFVRNGDIYTATNAGTSVRRLTTTPAGDSAPSWSPDGTRIVFATMHRAKDQARDDQRISVIDAEGGRLREITDGGPLFWADAPAWQPQPAAVVSSG